MADVGPKLTRTSVAMNDDVHVQVGLRGHGSWSQYARDGEWFIQLPHSCDEWLVGSGTPAEAIEAAESLIAGLRAAIDYIGERVPPQ